jgi:DNA (cytosine-5)-methyltransferase 1
MKKVLNLYCGIGGNRKLWPNDVQVTAIEINPKIAEIYANNFPNDTVIVTNAHKYLLKHIKEYDFIWSSPPCPTHSKLRLITAYQGITKLAYPEMSLYQEIILLKYFAKKGAKWVVENVQPYYIKPLIKPQAILNRHYIWSNFHIQNRSFEEDLTPVNFVENTKERYGFSVKGIKIEGVRTRFLLRNLVHPEIGLFLFTEAERGVKPLFNFDY